MTAFLPVVQNSTTNKHEPLAATDTLDLVAAQRVALAADLISADAGNGLEVGATDARLFVNIPASLATGDITAIRYTSSATWTKQAGLKFIEFMAAGPGGAGGGAPATAAANVSLGSPGTCGAYVHGIILAADLGATEAVTIGAGGTGVSGAAGNAGSGSTGFGSHFSCPAGNGGQTLAGGTSVSPLNGGLGATLPTVAATVQVLVKTIGAAPIPALRVSSASGYSTSGGSNPLGGGGEYNAPNTNGNAGDANTGGGGSGTLNTGSQAARTGGAGAAGVLIIKEYY